MSSNLLLIFGACGRFFRGRDLREFRRGPLALADAAAEGRLREGQLVLMTGMGAGLTWGSSLIEWAGGNGK